MNDDPFATSQQQVSPPSDQTSVDPQPAPVTPSPVDDVVAQASAVQDLFKKNDDNTVASNQQQVASDQPLSPAVNEDSQPPAPTDPSQRSPLDILEEILSKEEKKPEPTPGVEEGPTPEEIALVKQQEAEKQAMIESARQKMATETTSEEQKKRDAIRQQQMDANKVNNPFEIRQLQHKKINK